MKSKQWAYLVCVLPWLLPAVILALNTRPDGLNLTGPWSRITAGAMGEELVQLPKSWVMPPAESLVLNREIEVNDHLDEDWVLAVKELEWSVLRLSVNGRNIGDIGVWDSRDSGDFMAHQTLRIPAGSLRRGNNSLRLEIASDTRNRGIVDPRFMMVPASNLEWWQLRTSKIEAFLHTAPLLVFFLLLPLLLFLASLEQPRRDRRLTLRALNVVCAAAILLPSWTGLSIAGFVPTHVRQPLMLASAFWLATGMFEFIFDSLNSWPQRLIWINRAIPALIVFWSLFAHNSHLAKGIYGAWVMVVSVALLNATRRTWKLGASPRLALLASTTLCFIVTSLSDTLVNIGIDIGFERPRLFLVSLANLPLFVGGVVLASFVALAERNRALSGSLRISNVELAQALTEAREATRLKSEFLANVSHELRTPLNSIINIPQGLIDDFVSDLNGEVSFSGDPARSARYLKILHSSGLHLLGVVNQVLDFSKIEVGKLQLAIQQIVAKDVVDDVVRTLEPMASKRGIRFDVVGEANHELSADAVKVAQVLLNLGSNAVKFSPDGSRVKLVVESAEHFVTFHISDVGLGIAVENQALIFEGFRQVEGGATRRFGGTGLGLAISRKLVEAHGGTLRLESSLGKGSTFSASFPRRYEPKETVGVISPRRSIVVVDDEPIVQETLRLSLRSLLIDVVGVDDPRHALAVIRHIKPLLVVLDVMMPRISGVNLLRQIRTDPDLAGIHVLVLSAWPSNRDVVESLGAHWMSKPWGKDELISLVRRFVPVSVIENVGDGLQQKAHS
jgi:signal transduction histidine kinase/CheY-like chemotaxis protein